MDKPVKILMVDDRNENLLALEVILSGGDYKCVKASSGKEALKILLQEEDFAIILMDVQMPILDGFETAKLIRQSEKFKSVPIIFLTGNMITPEDIFKGYKTGAVDYMIKPLSAEILKAKVAIFADLYRKNKDLRAREEELKTLNSQLKKQSQYVRSLIEADLDALITINEEGSITDVNEAFENISGIKRDKLIGAQFSNYFTDAERAKKLNEISFMEGSVVDYLLTVKRTDGMEIEVLCNGSVYKDDRGNVAGVVIVAREKLLSKYARSLIEASLNPMITLNFKGKITDMNEALVRITGLTRNEIEKTNFWDHFVEKEKAEKVFESVFEKNEVGNSELTIRNRNGQLTDVLLNGSVYRDNRGNILGAVITARDITEQKRFEKELIEAKGKAEEAMQSKQQFLSNMSHEIRTPMNSIIGFTRLILKTDLTEKQKEYIHAIKVSGDTLIVLINDILDLAKVDAGKMTFEKIPFRLCESISTIMQLFDAKVQEKNITLTKHYERSIPEYLVGDPVRLHQVVINLLSNAIKFTQEGTVSLDVKLLNEDKEKVELEFSVKDTGIGIPKNKLDKIFDKFQQAEGNIERLYGGTGLGLAIVKELVEAQGGKISVESMEGKGSTFRFSLSFLKAGEKAISQTKEENELVEAEKTFFKQHKNSVRILVAEDVKLNQLLMKTLLEEFGFACDIVPTGRHAVEKLAQHNLNGSEDKYNVLLMDLHMPEMDGFEATEHIRKKMKLQIPIIALTADVTTVDLEKCKAIGMNDYVAKPVDEKLLYKKIMKFVNGNGHEFQNGNNGKENGTSHEDRTVNLDYIRQLTRNNNEMIVAMIKAYLEETPKLLSQLKKGIEQQDWKAIGTNAHSIVPSFSMVGIRSGYEEKARTIQEYAESRIHLQKIKELFAEIEEVCQTAMNDLQHEVELLEIH